MTLSKKNTYEFTLFVFMSCFAGLVNILARIVFSKLTTYEFAVFLAFLMGMLTGYLLSRRFVFEPSGQSVKREMTGFIFINIIAVPQVWGVSVGLYKWLFPLIDWTYEPALVAHICGLVCPIFTSYFGHKYISFRKRSG
jgi:putative flippase GtrA